VVVHKEKKKMGFKEFTLEGFYLPHQSFFPLSSPLYFSKYKSESQAKTSVKKSKIEVMILFMEFMFYFYYFINDKF
jgi:hypothetical protein